MSDEKDDVKSVMKIFSGSLANLALAMAFMFVAMPVFSWFSTAILGYSEAPKAIWQISMGIFLAIMFVDPVSSWTEKKSLPGFFWKFVFACILGIGFNYVIGYLVDNSGKDGKLSPVLITLFPLLLLPVLFGTFALKRFQENTNSPLKARITDATIEYLDTSGPIVMMLTGGVCMAFYWIIDPSLALLLPFLTTILAGMIIYVAFLYDGSEPPVVDQERNQERSKTLGEAFSKVLDVSITMLPSGLFMTGLIWVAMTFWDPSMFKFAKGNGEVDVIQILVDLIQPILIGLAVVPGGVMIASISGALSLAGVASIKKWSFSEVELRADKFQDVLFLGGMGKIFHGNLKERSGEE